MNSGLAKEIGPQKILELKCSVNFFLVVIIIVIIASYWLAGFIMMETQMVLPILVGLF